MPSRHVRTEVLALAILLIVAAAARWARLPVAWDYWAIDYLANVFPIRDDLASGALPWTRLVGLHPPQHALLSAGLLAGGLSARAALLLSLVLSVGGIGVGAWWVGRAAGPAGAVLFSGVAAVAPHGVHYGLELNNYPLFLAAMAATTAALHAAWTDPASRRAAAALGGCAAVALHAHFFAAALLGGALIATLVTRRWRPSAALGIAFVVAGPVLAAALGARGGRTQAFHNDRLQATEIAQQLWTAWDGRFGSAWTFGALAAATGVATALAVRDERTRAAAVTALALLAGGATAVLAGHLTAATDVGQTPYWVHVAWCQLALLGLGFGVADRRLRIALGLLLAPWLLAAGARAAAPAGWTSAPADAADPAALEDHLAERWGEGDVLVYLWDTPYPNDDPLHRDPAMAALPPSRIGDFTARDAPFPGRGHLFSGGEVYFVPSTGLRDDEHGAALREALAGWLAADRSVHLLFAAADPLRPAGDPSALGELAVAGGAARSVAYLGPARLIVIEPGGR